MDPLITIKIINRLAYEIYGVSSNYNVPTEEETNVGTELFKSIVSLCDSNNSIEIEETLDFFDDENECDQLESRHLNSENLESLYVDQESDDILQQFNLDYMQKIVNLKDQSNRSFASIQKMYPRVKNASYISRFRTYINKRGTYYQKIKNIRDYIKDKFVCARHQNLSVHDTDLRRWALEASRLLNYTDFKASPKFLLALKKHLNISSRKVTKIVTNASIRKERDINQLKEDHVRAVNSIIESNENLLILNTDQSGFNYEFYSTRTLSHVGEKSTAVCVQSANKTSHSYTIQPIISADGHLHSPLLICLQEKSNEFGPQISNTLQNVPDNVKVVCSTSGKLTKQIVSVWAKECLKPILTQDTLLLIDSWSGQDEMLILTAIHEENVDNENLKIMKIPPGTTASCQPLDVYFFRQWKVIVRAIYNRQALDNVQLLSDRLDIIRLHSLIHNQLSSPEYQNMIKYAWYKCGYSVDNPGKFNNVNEINFCKEVLQSNCNFCDDETPAFIRCAHCKTFLCLTHFFDLKCYHV